VEPAARTLLSDCSMVAERIRVLPGGSESFLLDRRTGRLIASWRRRWIASQKKPGAVFPPGRQAQFCIVLNPYLIRVTRVETQIINARPGAAPET
jgi:hypothetical protein